MTTDRVAFQGREGAANVGLRIGIVVMVLNSAVIHYSLGGTLFLLNALGYLGLLVALTLPFGPAERLQGVIRVALIGYAAATIVGWALMGPYFQLAYITKGIEVLLIAFLVAEGVRAGGVKAVVAELRSVPSELRGVPTELRALAGHRLSRTTA